MTRGSSSNLRGDVLQSPLEEAEDTFRQRHHDGASSSETQSQEPLGAHDYDSDYDSDDSTSSQTAVEPPATGAGDSADRGWFSLRKLPTLTLLHRNVLKCAIAYFIASLFTFSPTLSNLIGDSSPDGPGSKGPSPSAHMVATM